MTKPLFLKLPRGYRCLVRRAEAENISLRQTAVLFAAIKQGRHAVALTVTDSDVSFLNESNQKVNRNTFFRNGWVTNLDHIEEKRNLISDEIFAGYGTIQNDSKTDYDIGEQRNCEVIATISLKSLE